MSSHHQQIPKPYEDDFDAIFKQYYQKVKQFIEKFVSNRLDLDEIVQSVFIKVWNNMDSMAAIHDINSYLFVISRNTLRDYFRTQNRQKTKTERLSDNHEHTYGNTFDEAYENIIARELKSLVNTTVSKMPPKRRMVYTLSREEGKTSDEIAREMGISKRTVEKHLQMALSQIKRLLN